MRWASHGKNGEIFRSKQEKKCGKCVLAVTRLVYISIRLNFRIFKLFDLLTIKVKRGTSVTNLARKASLMNEGDTPVIISQVFLATFLV